MKFSSFTDEDLLGSKIILPILGCFEHFFSLTKSQENLLMWIYAYIPIQTQVLICCATDSLPVEVQRVMLTVMVPD